MSDLLNKASLVMVPSGYKEDTVYSVVPSDGSGDLSFTRASNGTRVNSAGLVEVCPWNLADNSEDMNNQPNNVDITVNLTATTSPIGTNNGNKVSETATTNLHAVRTNKATPNGYDIVSIYAKAAERTFIQIQSWADPSNYVNFNLSTGVVSAYSTATIYGIESVGNGWYRCYANVQASGNGLVGVGIITSGTAGWAESYLGDTSKGVYMWGLQINIGSTAKPYFPTTDRLNVPRLTYQNGGGGCPSLLLEKQSTNYARNWNLTAAIWSKNSANVTANAGTSPDGTNNAYLIYPSTSGTDRFIYDDQGSAGYSANTNYTTTVFAKAAGLNWAYIRFEDKSNISSYVYFNLATGVVGSTTGSVTIVSKTIEAMGNGWYRLRVTANMGTGTGGNNNVLFGVADGDGSTYATASGTNGVLFYGPQGEQSDYPTSPIPTSGSSATRVADACSKTGISSLIGQTEGVFYIDFNITEIEPDPNYLMVANLSNGLSNRLGFARLPDYGIHIYSVVGGVSQFTYNTTQTIGRFQLAMAYKANDYAVYLNGTSIYTNTSASVPSSMSRLDLGNLLGGYQSKVTISEAILFPTRLTNAELASLTTI